MKLLLDMNLSPSWVDFLENAGFQSVHWSNIGSHDAPDKEIMTWAKANGYVVFTHDLDLNVGIYWCSKFYFHISCDKNVMAGTRTG